VNKIIQGLRAYPKGELRQRVVALATELAPHAGQLNQHCAKFGLLFGLVASAWTYLSCLGKPHLSERKKVLQPHNTQILGVCRLLGLDEAALENHLIQINTGEGKSVALGFTAVLLSLLGFSVDVVCYSPYLSARDHQQFAELFRFFKVKSFIFYSDFFRLSGHIMRSGVDTPDILNTFDQFLRQKTTASGDTAPKSLVATALLSLKNLGKCPSPPPVRRKVLLLDEVDVFFSDEFYGAPYTPLQLLKVKAGGAKPGFNLLLHVWQHRGTLGKSRRQDSIVRLREHGSTKTLLSEFPNLASFLDSELDSILDDVSQFPVDGRAPHFYGGKGQYAFDVHSGSIVYTHPTTRVPTASLFYGYVTSFTYFYECDRRKLDPAKLLESGTWASSSVGVMMACGALAYSEIPRYYAFALGMTGTLDCLTEKQDALLKEYFFERRTFLPSTFRKKSLNAGRGGDAKETKVVRRKTVRGKLEGEMEDYFDVLKDEMLEELKKGRAVLIVFADLKRLQHFNLELHRSPPDFPSYSPPQLLTDQLENEERKSVVLKAFRPYTVTLMTKSYGRGTDFVCLSSGLISDGGAHVIITFFPEDDSEEKQILGRTCRQDDPGSARKIIFEEDIKPLGASEKRFSAQEKPWDEYLAECRAGTHERRMVAMDAAHENVMARHNATLKACEAAEQRQWEEAARLFKEASLKSPAVQGVEDDEESSDSD